MLTKFGRGAHAPRQFRRRWTFAVVAVGVVLLVDALTSQSMTRLVGHRSEMRAFSTTDSSMSRRVIAMPVGERPLRAIVVASPHDCIGNLRFANVLSRRDVAAVVGVPELVVQGQARDTIGLRRMLPTLLESSTMRLLQPSERALLHAIGHHATPVMLLFDQEGHLRIATQVESDAVTRTAIARAITHFATRDPAH